MRFEIVVLATSKKFEPTGEPRSAGTCSTFPSVEKLTQRETDMGLGKGALLWLVGIPLPIIILLMLFWR